MIALSIKQNLERIAPVLPGDVLLIAISGGLDSVVLAYLCKLEGYQFELAHCNFQLRGEESDRDENFVRALALSWGVPVHVQRFDTTSFATQQRLSIQESARVLRYEWFHSLTREFKTLKWILTAHHKDDQAETLLMNFLRGTGMNGLMGIPARHGRILRPLLSYSRDNLEQFALHNHINYVTDSSNQKEDYTRNYFRHSIMPAIKKVYPAVVDNLYDNQVRFTKIEKLYRQLVAYKTRQLLKEKNDEYSVSVATLKRFQDTSLLYELFYPFGFSAGQTLEAEKLLDARTGAQLVASDGKWRLVKHRKFLILSKQQELNHDFLLIHSISQPVDFPGGKLEFKEIKKYDFDSSTSQAVAVFERQTLEFPLLLRRWRAGDYFYPLGMSKKKKVARLLIDRKLSVIEKERIWVLTAGEKIIWVIGVRIDDRFKVRDNSKGAIQVDFTPLL